MIAYYFDEKGVADIAREDGGDGRRYRDEEGHFLVHTWKEIDGNLYYLKKDGTAATGQLRLGRQIYTFDSNGKMTGMTYIADGAFYDEDVKYYGGDGVFASRPDAPECPGLATAPGSRLWTSSLQMVRDIRAGRMWTREMETFLTGR